MVGHFRNTNLAQRGRNLNKLTLKVHMAGGGGGGRGTFPKNLWVEREALSEVKVFFLRTGEWRVESGEWRVESGEWRVE